MEINAEVYAIALTEELLRQACRQLSGKTFQSRCYPEALEPCSVLPITRTWYASTMRAEPTDGPEGWMRCLRECGRILGMNGAVVVEYSSPDAPDSYQEYAYTTPGGDAGHSKRLVAISSYTRVRGNRDISLVLDELFTGRTAQQRAYASRRQEKKEALRREKGDFEITADGILKNYLGNDIHVVIPDGVKEIGDSAFVDIKGLERMIMECEDYDAPPMETLVIPESVEKIDYYAFAYCTNLTEVEMHDHVSFIGERAFEGCENLKKIRLSAGLTAIEDNTFFLCDSLRTITIPEGVTRIGDGAFLDCSSLSKVVWPQSLKSIGKEAFARTRVKKAGLPDGATEIGDKAFPDRNEIG